MSLKPEIEERIRLLEEKYAASGQDLAAYLDGLLYSDYLTYWDYIHLDTLLSLQKPKTNIPDEQIFIMYHQITELYFKLSLHEFRQIRERGNDSTFLLARIRRINNYFKALIGSFDIMIEGMEKEQFLRFRMALLPASGFQSAQYRMIEICSTSFRNLVHHQKREALTGKESLGEMFENIYWKTGATELASGNKTLTLKQFEEKYAEQMLHLAEEFQGKTLDMFYEAIPDSDANKPLVREHLRELDLHVNVHWPLSHYKSAVRYLHKSPEDIAATGGTNWQKYLPPRFQLRIFYPALWSADELANWGKNRE